MAVRDKNRITHAVHMAGNRSHYMVGIADVTSCGRLFVPKHWKGHKKYINRADVVSMTRVVGNVDCIDCVAVT